jgi:soluble lytic murein transglycosylase
VGGLVALLLATSLARAATLVPDSVATDPVVALTEPERGAARALGRAHRALEEGRLDAARAALEDVHGVPPLEGYAELVRVRLLMEEGRAREAERLARAAIERSGSEALSAALAVLRGEALALAGDATGAERVWNEVLAGAAAEDEAVRDSIRLAIVGSRQRTGGLDAEIDPRVLLDQTYEDVTASTGEVPAEDLPPGLLLEKADAALAAGRSARAVELYDAALSGDRGPALDPATRREAELQRGHALFRSRRYTGAAAQFAALLPDVEARFWGARSRARSGDVDGALAEFERVVEAEPEGEHAAFASWALYLMGTLHESRGETKSAIDAYQRAAAFEGFPDRARDALWREGWAQFRSGAFPDARSTFRRLVERFEDPIDRLRPRYWAARAAMASGSSEDSAVGRQELGALAREFPLTYYGWRAQQRLAFEDPAAGDAPGAIAEGTRGVDSRAIERAALLIEGGLPNLARDELRFAARRANGVLDREQVGILLVRVGDYHRASQLVVSAYADSLARGLQAGRETLWWLSWPPAYREAVDAVFVKEAAVERFPVEPELVWAIMREESHYQVDARSGVGALGLLQLMPETAAELAREQGLEAFDPGDLFDAKTNIALGAAYLARLLGRFDGRLSAAIASYNAGPSRVATWLRGDAARLEDDVWVEDIPYDQTRAYVRRVLRSLYIYKTFYR